MDAAVVDNSTQCQTRCQPMRTPFLFLPVKGVYDVAYEAD
jgi:hypothetical protein